MGYGGVWWVYIQLSTMRGAAPVMFPLRLVEWFFTTPIIISLLSCHLKRTKANLAIKRAALLSDWFMIISGFFEQRYADPLGAIWLVASCVRSQAPPPSTPHPPCGDLPDGLTDDPVTQVEKLSHESSYFPLY